MDRGRSDRGVPNPIDFHVGSRLRLRRTLLGMTLEQLGEAMGLTFQQVQKYERGSNRIGAGRLFDLARVLGVPVEFFFGRGELPARLLEEFARPGGCLRLAAAVLDENGGELVAGRTDERVPWVAFAELFEEFGCAGKPSPASA